MNQLKQKTRAAVYTRVSSDEQAKGYSLIFQQDEIKEVVLKDGAVLSDLNIYVDDGYTGITGNRPALKSMTEAAKRKEFDVIYVWKIDRLFRNTKLVLNLVDDLAAVNVGVKSILEPFCDSSTAVGRYMFTMMAAGAEMEHANINERTQHGKLRAMKEGKWLGAPPYGYNLNGETKKLELNEDEAKWVRKFYKWLVDDRLSLFRVQKKANALSIPTKADNLGKVKPKTSRCFWARRTLGRILTNELYFGKHVYRKYKSPRRVRKDADLRAREEWIEISVPPVISRELFDMAQEQLSKNKTNSPRRTKRFYMFAKKLQCGVCQSRMHAFHVPGKLRKDGTRKSFRFYAGTWRLGISTNRRCENCVNYNEEKLEVPIWDGIVDLLSQPQRMMSKVEAYRKRSIGPADIGDLRQEYENKSVALEAKKDRLLNAYLDAEISKDQYKGRLTELDEQKRGVLEQQRHLQHLMLSRDEKMKRIASAKALYKKIQQKLIEANYERRCRIVGILVENITLRGNNADIEVNLPARELVQQTASELMNVSVAAGVGDTWWDRGGVGRDI